MKILANDGLAPEGVKMLKEAGYTVITEKINQDQLAQAINEENYEILLVRSATQVRKDLIDSCPGIKLIGRGGVGMDNIDVAHARSKEIKVVNTPAASSQSVAELVFGHLFGLCRFLPDSNRMMPDKGSSEFEMLKKKYSKGIELRGKTLGIIGFGRIGQAVASYALGIGMKVKAFDTYVASAGIPVHIEGIDPVSVEISTRSFEEVLMSSDFISIHTPAQKDGKPVITEKEISMMKNGAVLVNASRGGIVDESAIDGALKSGKLKGVALDVFLNEPSPNAELLKNPGLSLSPHIGAATAEAQNRISLELASQIIETFQHA